MREKIKLLSTADTGHFYVTTKNKRLHPDKMEVRKFDPVAVSTWLTRKPRSSNRTRVRHGRIRGPGFAGPFCWRSHPNKPY